MINTFKLRLPSIRQGTLSIKINNDTHCHDKDGALVGNKIWGSIDYKSGNGEAITSSSLEGRDRIIVNYEIKKKPVIKIN